MAGSASIEVRELFPPALDDLGDDMRRHFAEQCGAGGRVGWAAAGGRALQAIRDKLSFDVVRGFGSAWAKLQELRDYKDESKHPRDKDEQYQLGKNRVRAQGGAAACDSHRASRSAAHGVRLYRDGELRGGDPHHP